MMTEKHFVFSGAQTIENVLAFLKDLPEIKKPKVFISTGYIYVVCDFAKIARPSLLGDDSSFLLLPLSGTIIFGTSYEYKTISIDGRSSDFIQLTADRIVEEDIVAIAQSIFGDKYFKERSDSFALTISDYSV